MRRQEVRCRSYAQNTREQTESARFVPCFLDPVDVVYLEKSGNILMGSTNKSFCDDRSNLLVIAGFQGVSVHVHGNENELFFPVGSLLLLFGDTRAQFRSTDWCRHCQVFLFAVARMASEMATLSRERNGLCSVSSMNTSGQRSPTARHTQCLPCLFKIQLFSFWSTLRAFGLLAPHPGRKC